MELKKYYQISKDDFIEKSLLDEQVIFENYGPRVKYFKYQNGIIIFGRFKYSYKYEVILFNMSETTIELIETIMDIIKEYYFNKDKLADIYIPCVKETIYLYQKIIIAKIQDFNLEWNVIQDKYRLNEIIISKNKKVYNKWDIMHMKHIINKDQKDFLECFDYIKEVKRTNKHANIQRMVKRKRAN